MFKRLAAVVVCLLLVSIVIGCAKQEPERIVLNEVTHSVFYAPLYAAISLGYFEEEGLTIDLVNGGGRTNR